MSWEGLKAWVEEAGDGEVSEQKVVSAVYDFGTAPAWCDGHREIDQVILAATPLVSICCPVE